MRITCYFVLMVFLLSNGFSQRLYRKNIAIANAYYKVEQFAQAKEYYLRSFKINKNDSLSEKIAHCDYLQRHFKEAKKWFEACVNIRNESHQIQYLNCLLGLQDYNAIKKYVHNRPSLHKKHEVSKILSCIDSIHNWETDSAKVYKIIKTPALNTIYSEINPMWYKKGIVFSSSQEKIIIKAKEGQNLEPYYDLYFSDTATNGKWHKPASFSPVLNSVDHEGAVAFSKNEDTIFFTRGIHKDYNSTVNDATNYLKLYMSTRKGLIWSKPLKFSLNDSLASFGHPAIGFNDKIFIFTSDMAGGYGGSDLYITLKLDTGWKAPVNMGPQINSNGNELYPFLLDHGVLYFTSNGHIGYGGYDIYKSEIVDGEWCAPINLRSPINSSYDDLSLIIDKLEKNGFFSSNRPNGKGGEDLYKFQKE
jgi:tetratricopeptide (TPR) repeat protein